LRFFFIDAQELVLGYDVNLDPALLVGFLDRLHHHRIRLDLGDDQCRHPLLDETERRAAAGLPNCRARKGHDIVDRFG
jgi:hypothetical protein